ncbi:MAG: polysaccharide deacetylase family protein [Wenzhouxiangellaceae bacterium]|nr:polysaccharide deacetylase family protein [Wenzhouxiangellaceae bacterium]
MPLRLLVSIHDVMPTTLTAVEDIFNRLLDAGLQPVTLLVVPGTGWTANDLDRLRALVAAGAELAGHGWVHAVRHVRGLRHRLHAALISRRAAEHLALATNEIMALMRANHAWFGAHGLPDPSLYVPPAWAMGNVSPAGLRELPFARHETLLGVREAASGRFRALPMAGFEADTQLRAAFVAPFNLLNRRLAHASDRPLRLGIHPHDFELKLAASLADWIARGGRCLSYSELAAA